MDLDQLSNMKYADLQKLAKEKLNITKRVSKAKLIQSLVELNWLSDDGTDKSADEAPEPEEKSKTKRGRKRGKNSRGENKEEESPPTTMPSRKKSKIEVALNSTFSLDKDFLSSDNLSENELPVAPAQSEPKPKTVRGCVRKAVRKLNQQLRESTSSELGTTDKTQDIIEKIQDSTISDLPEEMSKPSALTKNKNDKIPTTTKVELEKRRLSNRTVQSEKKNITQPKTPAQQASGVKCRSSTKTAEVTKLIGATPMSTKKGVQFPLGTSTSKLKPRAAPNFAEIHQKQFEKMQSVDEYVEKKRQRTETISMSAVKTMIPRKRSITKTPNDNIKNRTKPSPNPVVPSTNPTPAARTKLDFNFVSGIQKPVFTAQGLVATEKRRLMATLKENHLGQGNTAVKTMKKSSLSASKADLSSSVNSNKNKQVSTEGKQQMLKGVRVNRRFQLQMQHRNLKN